MTRRIACVGERLMLEANKAPPCHQALTLTPGQQADFYVVVRMACSNSFVTQTAKDYLLAEFVEERGHFPSELGGSSIKMTRGKLKKPGPGLPGLTIMTTVNRYLFAYGKPGTENTSGGLIVLQQGLKYRLLDKTNQGINSTMHKARIFRCVRNIHASGFDVVSPSPETSMPLQVSNHHTLYQILH